MASRLCSFTPAFWGCSPRRADAQPSAALAAAFALTPGGSCTNFTPYGGSKGLLHAFAKGVALEQAAYGVRANCVCPGAIDTAWTRGADSPIPLTAQEGIGMGIPLGRRGTPEEMANIFAGKRGVSREPHFDGLPTRVVFSLKTRGQGGGVVRDYQIARTQHFDKSGSWQVAKTTRSFADQQFCRGGPLDG